MAFYDKTFASKMSIDPIILYSKWNRRMRKTFEIIDCLFLFLFSFLKSEIAKSPGDGTKAPFPSNAVTAQCRQARLDPVPPPLLSISLTGSDLEFVIDINNPNITSYLFWFTWINFSSNCVWFKQRILLINNYIYNVLNRMTNFLKDKN